MNVMHRLTVASSEREDSWAPNAYSVSSSLVCSIMNMETAKEVGLVGAFGEYEFISSLCYLFLFWELLAYENEEELKPAIRDAGVDNKKLVAYIMHIVLDEDDFERKSGFNTSKPAIDKRKISSIEST